LRTVVDKEKIWCKLILAEGSIGEVKEKASMEERLAKIEESQYELSKRIDDLTRNLDKIFDLCYI